MINTAQLISQFKLFWQYPVITEKTFYNQEKSNPLYFGFPWATILDKKYNLQVIYKLLYTHIENHKTYYTCCQHISFRILIPLFKALNITTVFSPHKIIGEDEIDGINIRACPLYAVNVEDNDRNKQFRNVDFNTHSRNLTYSFAGGYQSDYMTDIRSQIINMKHDISCCIINTGDWHFNQDVYNKSQNVKGELNEDKIHKQKTQIYNMLLLNSRYTLCPSGSGPNSIRFWEALGVGSIPILLSDKMTLPEHKEWDNAILKIPEKDLEKIPEILLTIPEEKEKEMRKKCLEIYQYLKNNFSNGIKNIVHYCCGAYHLGHIGGVARYDYQISRTFPRVFFRGPEEKDILLKYLEKYPNTIVITDNHLACDIPNEIYTLLVHHGCAKTHAIREPLWPEPWKSLCTNGQNKMLTYRNIENTKIISISQFCTDEFTKHYSEIYKKFENILLLHSSELNESLYKKTWNKKPVILGNWSTENKGMKIVQQLNSKSGFIFKNLNIKVDQNGIDVFNKHKQNIYLESDIFLQISLCEGNSYATLDALLCGIPIVASNVGLFYKDVPEDCFVKIEWERNNDLEYIENKIKYAWKNRDILSRKCREWYLQNCSYIEWKKQITNII